MKVSVLSFLLRLILLLSFTAFSLADEPVSTGFFGKTAIGGHDAAAYHNLPEEGKSIKGEKTFSVEWKGAQWHFVSQEDSELFAANPEKYAPAYNGHCANALSLGEGLIKTNGKHWAIFDEQLYLFYAARGAARWKSGDYKVFKAEADNAWSKILAK